jgi:valyl-tRNA synthetase
MLDLDKEVARLEKELDKLNKEVERIEKKLNNQGFLAKAPSHVVEEEKAKQQDYAAKRQTVIERIAELKA